MESQSVDGDMLGGWEVRMQRHRSTTSKYFADSVHGGKLAALREAKLFRDSLESSHEKMSVADKAKTPSTRNRSGTVGVRLHQQKDTRGEYEYYYWYWVAQWTDGHGRRRTKSFSVEKHGEDEAYRLACAARKQGVGNAKR